MSVRWDAVVKNRPFRSSGRVADVAAPAAPAAAPEAAGACAPIEIQLWLFGMPAGTKTGNPVVLQFARGCALRDVFDELGRRLGSEFMRALVSESGDVLNTCRVFLGGEIARDMTARIAGTAATVEIILLREIEGG